MNYQVGEVVLYGTEGICTVLGTEEKRFGSEALMYYVLESKNKGSRIFVPFANETLVNRIRRPQTEEDMKCLLSGVETLEQLTWHENDRERKTYHMGIVANAGARELLQLLKTIRCRRIYLEECGKKLYATDERIYKDAMTLLVAEIGVCFDLDEAAAKQMLLQSWEMFGMYEE